MRHIKIDGEPPETWRKNADDLTRKLCEATEQTERDKIIEEHGSLWRQKILKDWLLGLFNFKCWYSESIEKVSAYHVDHFRPKGRVTDGDVSREGYWWLSFEWTNYRICGQLLNVRKKDYFPIEEGGRIANRNQKGSEKYEDNMLLDPLVEEDVALISFERNGEVVYAEGISEVDKKRVDLTNDIIGLNKLELLTRSRQTKWKACEEQIDLYKNVEHMPKSVRAIQKANAKANLKKTIEYGEEYSSVALACIHKKAPLVLKNQILA